MIDQIVLNVKAKINNTLTLEQELEQAKDEAREIIENYKYDANFSSSVKNRQNEIVYEALTKINNATSVDTLDQIVNETKALIDALPTKIGRAHV